MLERNRQVLDALLDEFLPGKAEPQPGQPGKGSAKGTASTEVDPDLLNVCQTARHARHARFEAQNGHRRLRWSQGVVAVLFGTLLFMLIRAAWLDTYADPLGEPLSFLSGTSMWPVEFLRLMTIALTAVFIIKALFDLQQGDLLLTRRYRFCNDPSKEGVGETRCSKPRWWLLPAINLARGRAVANDLWIDFRTMGSGLARLGRVAVPCIAYFLLLFFLYRLVTRYADPQATPVRGNAASVADLLLTLAAAVGFLGLTFLILDAARLCAWFIRNLSEVPSIYPPATLLHFRRQRGQIERQYLPEWLDVNLVADLTERVGKLVWYPSVILLSLVLLVRSRWWDNLSFPLAFQLAFVLNLLISAGAIMVLQRVARRAKATLTERLATKLRRLQSAQAKSPAEKYADRTRELLEEIKNLHKGAFVPLRENPVVGALLLPSSGLVLMQLLLMP